MCKPTTRLLLMCLLLPAAGCVERIIAIDSDPPGALVYLNDVEVGRTPLEVPFEFYGVYDVRVERDGYRTLSTTAEAKGPWWELPGPDLVAEALPGDRDVRIDWRFELEPAGDVDTAALLERAGDLRNRFGGSAPTADAEASAP